MENAANWRTESRTVYSYDFTLRIFERKRLVKDVG